MKTITFNENNVSVYLFDDETFVDIQSDKTIIGDPVQFIVNDCNDSNATLFENVTNPDKWIGGKYFYTDTDGWVLNPDWDPPTPAAE